MGLSLYNPPTCPRTARNPATPGGRGHEFYVAAGPTTAGFPCRWSSRSPRHPRRSRDTPHTPASTLTRQVQDRHHLPLPQRHPRPSRFPHPRAPTAWTTTTAAATHHGKPKAAWAADASEGLALARSDLPLPGERAAQEGRLQDAVTSSSALGSRGRNRNRGSPRGVSALDRWRPPSLKRQDAFRHPTTPTRPAPRARLGLGPRRIHSPYDEQRDKPPGEEDECLFRMEMDDDHGLEAGKEEEEDGEEEEEEEARQVAELYRLGLLYDDEHERGEAFSLDRIVRDEPVYSVRVRRPRSGRTRSSSSSSSSRRGGDWLEEMRRDRAPLVVIYESVDEAESAAADDFLDYGSISEASFAVEDDEFNWELVGRCNGPNGKAAPATGALAVVGQQEEEDTDPWVALDYDGPLSCVRAYHSTAA